MTLLLIGLVFSIVSTLIFYLYVIKNWMLILVFVLSFIVFVLLFLLSAYIIALTNKIERKDSEGKIIKIKPKKIYKYYTYLTCSFLKIFFRVKVNLVNKNLIPKEEPFLLVCNHQSLMDPIIIMASTKRVDIYYIMKKQIRKIPIVGRWLKEAGYYYLDRDNNREGLKLILDCINDLKNGKNVGLFIEGTRSKGPNLGHFHDASLKLALKSKVKVLVACVDDCYKIKKNYPFKKSKVLLKFCEVIDYNEYSSLSTIELGEKIKEIIQTNLDMERNKK